MWSSSGLVPATIYLEDVHSRPGRRPPPSLKTNLQKVKNIVLVTVANVAKEL